MSATYQLGRTIIYSEMTIEIGLKDVIWHFGDEIL